MNPSLRQLRAFVAVAEAGSFTEAARRLHLTQSALSVLVRELERELGVRLLDRHTRQVRLSDAGREFEPQVRRLLRELEAAVEGVAQLRDKKRGSVRIAAPQLMACTLMPRVIAAYARRFPEIRVRLADTAPEQMLARLQDGEADLAVGPDLVTEGEVRREPLVRDRHWLICPPGHALARGESVCWRELAPHPLIAPTRDFMRRVMPELAAHEPGLEVQPVHEASYMSTALGMVQAGLGVTVCPTYAAPLVRAFGLEMRALVEPVFYREVCLYMPAGRSLSPAADSFAEFLSEHVKGEEAGRDAACS
ncbi:LysR family transcriptional regulator [Caldimonas tepidiphila]|uniref:LysR family transcriptional regulator n=1 Tax=Caldimonas tepidiphila TaxID=2315841 RepID=UPI000E5B880B|nr:LysR family transcriptional regulator [Caldimonas tepidiphila]